MNVRSVAQGVLQVEALAQLAGILLLKEMDEGAKQNFFFGGIENCRFRKPVVPGDTLVDDRCDQVWICET